MSSIKKNKQKTQECFSKIAMRRLSIVNDILVDKLKNAYKTIIQIAEWQTTEPPEDEKEGYMYVYKVTTSFSNEEIIAFNKAMVDKNKVKGWIEIKI